MRNQHVNNKLSAYAANELPAEESRQIAEHLFGCTSCRREYEEIRIGVRLASTLTPISAPPDLWVRVSRQLDAPSASDKSPRNLRGPWLTLTWPRLIAAGIGAAGLMIALTWYFSRPGTIPEQIAVHPTPQPTSIPSAERPPATPEPSPGRTPRQMAIERSGRTAGLEVVSLAGEPTVETRKIDDRGRISVGEWLETDAGARAQINIAEIGNVELEPNSRLSLMATRRSEHRLKLARGRLKASIYAPPRLFIVETPAATAIDLGCEYTLEVDESGAAYLRVTSGFVALVDGSREVIVPAGAACQTQPQHGPGTPYFEDATAAFRRVLARFDATGNLGEALPQILAEARRRDTLTLWHLLQIASAAERGRICDRMIELYGPPDGVTREGLIGLDRVMLESYRKRLEWVW